MGNAWLSTLAQRGRQAQTVVRVRQLGHLAFLHRSPEVRQQVLSLYEQMNLCWFYARAASGLRGSLAGLPDEVRRCRKEADLFIMCHCEVLMHENPQCPTLGLLYAELMKSEARANALFQMLGVRL